MTGLAPRVGGRWSADRQNVFVVRAHYLRTSGGVRMRLAGTTIRLRRLSDGRARTIRAPGTGVVDADLTVDGLAYAYNTPTVKRYAYGGHVVFVPFSRLFR